MAQGGGLRRCIGGLRTQRLRSRPQHADIPSRRHCRIAGHPVNDAPHRCLAADQRQPAAGPVAQWLEPAAHNGLVAGSSPAGPTNEIKCLSIFIFLRHQKYHTISNGLVENKQVFSTALTESGRARRLACRSRRQRKVSTHDVCFCSMIGHSLATSAVPKCATNGLMHGSNQRTAHFVRNAVAYRAAQNSRWSWLCSEKACGLSLASDLSVWPAFCTPQWPA